MFTLLCDLVIEIIMYTNSHITCIGHLVTFISYFKFGIFRQKHLVPLSHLLSLLQQIKPKHFPSLTCSLGLTYDLVVAIEIQAGAVLEKNLKNMRL